MLKITMPLDYISGHLHRADIEVEIDEKDWELFKELEEKSRNNHLTEQEQDEFSELYDEIMYNSNIINLEYEIDDLGAFDVEQAEIEEF